MINCLLLQNDAAERKYFDEIVQDAPNLRVRNHDGNLVSALHSLRHEHLGLVICDLSQMQTLKREYIASQSSVPLFICTTHLKDYNIEDLPVKPFSVLRYPVSSERILATVNRATSMIHSDEPAKDGGMKRDFVFIKSEYKIIKVKFDDILFCEGMKDYTQIYLSGKAQPVLTLHNLKNFIAKLPSNDFIRVHRSYVVSLNHVDTISRNEIMVGKKIIPIGNSYRNNLFQIVEMNS